MKKILVILLFINCKSLIAQNLIPNGGFEEFDSLPNWFGQFNRCIGWDDCGGTGKPDYFHVNGKRPEIKLPNTAYRYVNPHGGNAIMGLCLWAGRQGIDYREYITRSLKTPLSVGNSYKLSFFFSNGLPNGGVQGNGIDQFSILLSTFPPKQLENNVIKMVHPQFVNNTILFNTNWREISYIFKSDSAYNFITIGNFQNDSFTNHQLFDSTFYISSYYFIDDIELTQYTNSVNNNFLNNSLTVYPNPFCDRLNIELIGDETYQLIIYDNLSRKVIEETFSKSIQVRTEKLNPGFYYYEIRRGLALIKRSQICKDKT